jgi:hypothetical protein
VTDIDWTLRGKAMAVMTVICTKPSKAI